MVIKRLFYILVCGCLGALMGAMWILAQPLIDGHMQRMREASASFVQTMMDTFGFSYTVMGILLCGVLGLVMGAIFTTILAD